MRATSLVEQPIRSIRNCEWDVQVLKIADFWLWQGFTTCHRGQAEMFRETPLPSDSGTRPLPPIIPDSAVAMYLGEARGVWGDDGTVGARTFVACTAV